MGNECPICTCVTRDAVQPCGHLLCLACAETWLVRKPTCPMCRETVVSVASSMSRDAAHKVIRLTPPGVYAGTTLRNAKGGVVVVDVVKRDAAQRGGMRKGDVITHMNNVPVAEHAHAVSILNRAAELHVDVRCTLRDAPFRPFWARHWTRRARPIPYDSGVRVTRDLSTHGREGSL